LERPVKGAIHPRSARHCQALHWRLRNRVTLAGGSFRPPNLAEEQFEHAHPRDGFGLGVRGIAIVYWLVPAGSLPSVFPGFEAGSPHVHVKHGLAAAVVAVVLFAVAWYAPARAEPS
jgi:hypothetical protein